MDFRDILATVRREGSDNREVEVKSAKRGYPDSTLPTLSAFANTPGGGQIIFGIDENDGFALTGVYDVAACQQAVSAAARNGLAPQITVTSELVTIDGVDFVIAYVPETSRDVKPVRVVKTGKAYVRLYDGDYPLSQQEEQILIAQRGQPRDDDQPVEEATRDDLDSRAVAEYIERRRLSSRRFSGLDDNAVLIRTGVLTHDERHPSLAGILALGQYPQQFFPGLAIQVSLVGSDSDVRALDTLPITGPIPAMVDECMDWVSRVTQTAIVSDATTGKVRNRPAYPPLAIRELVANALIHRDLSSASINEPVTCKILKDKGQLLISNPGGLFGVSVEGLGKSPSSPRNARLAEILQFVTDRHGDRVVERLGSGIPIAQETLRDADMEPLRFDDRGVRFTVFVEEDRKTWGGWAGVSLVSQRILDILRDGPATIADLARQSRLEPRQVRGIVASLVDSGHLLREPLDGRTNQYRLAKP